MPIQRDANGKIVVPAKPGASAEVKGGPGTDVVAPTNQGSGDGALPKTRRPINERFRCTAHSSRTGLPCKRAAIKGGNVCPKHGGRAIQVKTAARRRLDMNADRAVKTIVTIMTDEAVPPNVRLSAAKDIIDRNGKELSNEGATVHVELTGFDKDVAGAIRIKRYDPDEDDTIDAEVVDEQVLAIERYSSTEATFTDALDDENAEATIDLPLFAPPSARPREYRPPAPTEERVNVDPPIPESVRRRMPGGVSPGGKRRTPSSMG